MRATIMEYSTMVKAKSVLRGNTESPTEMIGPVPLKDRQGRRISQQWAAEFRGWFWGEGSFKASTAGPSGQSLSLGIVLGLRADDEPIIKEFQRRLGGTVNVRPYHTGSDRFMARWQVTDMENMPRIAAILRKSAIPIPSHKSRQYTFWVELMEMKIRRGAYSGSRYTPDERERRKFLVAEIKRLKKWGS